jgi:predicted GIY-YIG superfamily endonuclease
MYYVYVLQEPASGSLYYGFSGDLKARVASHQRSAEHAGWRLVYYEAYRSDSDARRRERKLKQYGARARAFQRRESGRAFLNLKGLESAGRRRAFCLMSLRVTVRGEPKAFWAAGVAKASPKGAPQLRAVDPKRR